MSDNNNDSDLKQIFVTQTMGYKDVNDKKEIWQAISDEFDGEFKASNTIDHALKMFKINISYNNCQIILSESDTHPLKFEISFNSLIAYDLVIGVEDSIDKLMKMLGKKELEIGNKSFDDKYLISSNDSGVTKMFITKDIIDSFLNLNLYSFAFSTDNKAQTASLISVISRTVEDKAIISELVKLHFRIIDSLKDLKLVE